MQSNLIKVILSYSNVTGEDMVLYEVLFEFFSKPWRGAITFAIISFLLVLIPITIGDKFDSNEKNKKIKSLQWISLVISFIPIGIMGFFLFLSDLPREWIGFMEFIKLNGFN